MTKITFFNLIFFLLFPFYVSRGEEKLDVHDTHATSSWAMQGNRPKVGVVLSGGGAKGSAHIGALRVIEQAGIPIDIIVGTSMGSIVGGLYSIGYSPSDMDSLFLAQDWNALLTDKANPQSMHLHAREISSKYILSVPFFEKPQDVIGGGMVKGRNIGRMLWNLTQGYHDSIDFKKMPIPFACVAQDIVSGQEKVMTSGVLPIAIRASMSIPGVFAPISLHNELLIDGGLVNNYPVDVARSMGADIIIGVDVQDSLKDANHMRSNIIAQLNQIIDIQGRDRRAKNIEATNVYIKVNVNGYSTASFTTQAIDTLIHRGEQAAWKRLKELQAIGQQLHITHKRKEVLVPHSTPGTLINENLSRTHIKYLETLIGKPASNSINLGVRFDNEELAALIFNGQVNFGKNRKHALSLTARLGIQTYGEAIYRHHIGKYWNFHSSYRYTYNDFYIHEKGNRLAGVNFNNHSIAMGISKGWKNSYLTFSADYKYYDYSSFLFRFQTEQEAISQESYLKVGTDWVVNTLNDIYFPTRGTTFNGTYNYVLPTNGLSPFHIGGLHWSGAFSFNSRFTILPSIHARYITTENIVSQMNTLGGQEYGKYFSQQIPFYGINYFEMAHRALTIAGIEVRQRIGAKHYISAAFNIALTADDWTKFFRNSFSHNDLVGYRVYGAAIRYDLRTFFGPVGFTFSLSDRSKAAGYARAGFNF